MKALEVPPEGQVLPVDGHAIEVRVREDVDLFLERIHHEAVRREATIAKAEHHADGGVEADTVPTQDGAGAPRQVVVLDDEDFEALLRQ
jgi:hypothetical protein